MLLLLVCEVVRHQPTRIVGLCAPENWGSDRRQLSEQIGLQRRTLNTRQVRCGTRDEHPFQRFQVGRLRLLLGFNMSFWQ